MSERGGSKNKYRQTKKKVMNNKYYLEGTATNIDKDTTTNKRKIQKKTETSGERRPEKRKQSHSQVPKNSDKWYEQKQRPGCGQKSRTKAIYQEKSGE